jgi:hypothetical protein
MLEVKSFRVFVTRHYIAVDWFDVKAESPRKAASKARKYVRRARPDVRAEATDNHWQTDEPVELKKGIGSWDSGIHKMSEVATGVFHTRD